MPTPAPENLLYLRWCFSLYSAGAPVEIAEFGLYAVRVHFAGNDVDWEPDLADCAAKCRDRWVTEMEDAAQLFSNAVRLDHVDAYQIGPDGKAAHKGSVAATGDDAWVGSSTSGLPWQCSVAVTTTAFDPLAFTTDAVGKRGRFYLPPFGAGALDADGRLSANNQNSLRIWVGNFLNAVQGINFPGVNAGDDDYVDLRVYSQWKNKTRRTVGVASPLTHYRVGRVIDTQRRRRNQLTEAYTDGTVEHS